MRNRTQALFLTVVLGLAFSLSACSKPEEKIVDHMENMAEIMEDNMDSPKDGVEELRSYMQDNLPDMMAQFGEAMVELDKIEDPKERAERAKEMVDAIQSASEGMAKTGMEFAGKAMEDEEAMKYMEEWAESWEDVGEAMEGLKDLSGALM